MLFSSINILVGTDYRPELQTCNSLLLRVLLPSPQHKSGSSQTILPPPQHKFGSRQYPTLPHEKRRFCAHKLSINLKIVRRYTLILTSFYIMLKRAPKTPIF